MIRAKCNFVSGARHLFGEFQPSPIARTTRAGFPAARLFGGTSLVTTEPAATTEFSPIVTPPMIVAPVAIQTFLSIIIGFPIVTARRCDGSSGWPRSEEHTSE